MDGANSPSLSALSISRSTAQTFNGTPDPRTTFFVFSMFLLVFVYILEVEYFSILYFSTFHFAKWSANAQWDGGATKGLCWENVSRNPQRRLSRLSPSNMLEEKCENPIGRNGSGGLWKIKKCVNIDRCWDFVFGKNELFIKTIEKTRTKQINVIEKNWLLSFFSISNSAK